MPTDGVDPSDVLAGRAPRGSVEGMALCPASMLEPIVPLGDVLGRGRTTFAQPSTLVDEAKASAARSLATRPDRDSAERGMSVA